MVDPLTGFAAYLLVAAFMAVGLLVHERTGFRLGGVIVLPLLLIYALFDLTVILVFALAAALAFGVGTLVHGQTLVYGRRMFIVFLVLGVLGTALARWYVPTSVGGFALAVVPGVFAYNLHREGHYVRAASTFALWFGILLVAGSLALWLIGTRGGTAPGPAPAGVGMVDVVGSVVAVLLSTAHGLGLPFGDFAAPAAAAFAGLLERFAATAGPFLGRLPDPALALASVGGVAALLEAYPAGGEAE